MSSFPPLPPDAETSLSAFMPLADVSSMYIDPAIAYQYRLAMMRALRDIPVGCGKAFFDIYQPRFNNVIASGTITGITATGFTDSGASFGSPHRCGDAISYSDCFIEILVMDDPRFVARCGLQGNTSGTAMNFSSGSSPRFGNANDWPARGVCGAASTSSLSDLIGCQYLIFSAINGDIGPYDRWPDPPNAMEFVQSGIGQATTAGSHGIFPTSLLTSNASSGNFNLSIGTAYTTSITANIPWNFSSGSLQSAIQAVPAMNGSNCQMANYSGGYAIAFDSILLPVTITINGSNVSGGSVAVSTLSNLLLDTNQNWNPGRFNVSQPSFPGSPPSFDLMVYNNGGGVAIPLVNRLSITANSNNSIGTGSLGTFVPSLPTFFSIVGKDGWWAPFNIGGLVLSWNGTKATTDFGVTHWPDDSISAYAQPKLDVGIDNGVTIVGCDGPVPYILYNADVVSDCSPGMCSPADKYYNPNIFKYDLGIQLTLMGFCSGPWIDPLWPDDATPTPPNQMIRPNPMLFPTAALVASMNGSDISAFNTSITSVSMDQTKGYIGISLPYPQPTLNWEMRNQTTGAIISAGSTVLQEDGTGVYIQGLGSTSNVGCPLRCTWGFSNTFEYEFSRLTAKLTWEPSQDSSGNVVDPPTIIGGAMPVPNYANGGAAQSNSSSVSVSVFVSTSISSLTVFTTMSGTGDPGSGSISDSNAQTWDYIGFQNTSGGAIGCIGCWVLGNAIPGATTITFSPANQASTGIVVQETIGTFSGSPVDTYQSHGANNSNPATTAITTTAANDIILCFGAFWTTNAAWTFPAAWTDVGLTSPAVAPNGYALEVQAAPTATSYTTGFNISAGQYNACFAVALKRATQSAYLGYWRYTPASTNYNRYDLGMGQVSAEGPAFAAGDLARYRAQEPADPTIPGFRSTGSSPLIPYIDRAFVGTCGTSPTNPLFIGKVFNAATGTYFGTNVDSQGTGTLLMVNTVASFQTTSGVVSQISFTPMVDNNLFQRPYNISSSTITGTATNGSASTLISASTFDTSFWGCQLTVTNVSGGATFTSTIDGSGLTAGTIHFSPAGSFNVSSGCMFQIIRPGCVNYYHFFQASGGSSTTFVDSAMAADPRFATGFYNLGYTLRTFQPLPSGAQAMTKFFITGTNQSTGTLTVNPVDGVTIANGWLGEVDWMLDLNNYAGLWATASGGNASGSAMVSGNDQSGFFFNTSSSTMVNVSAGTIISLTSFLPYSVLKRDPTNTFWMLPTGTDPRPIPGSSTHPQFPKDPRNGCPFLFSQFGPIHKGTIPTEKMWNQWFAVAKTFTKFLSSNNWTANGSTNTFTTFFGFATDPDYATAFSDAVATLEYVYSSTDDAPPFASVGQETVINYGAELNFSSWSMNGVGVGGIYSYGQVSNPSPVYPVTAKLYFLPNPSTGSANFSYGTMNISNPFATPCDGTHTPYNFSAPTTYQGPGMPGIFNLWDTESLAANAQDIVTGATLGAGPLPLNPMQMPGGVLVMCPPTVAYGSSFSLADWLATETVVLPFIVG